MRRTRPGLVPVLLAVVAHLAVMPPPVVADHCGGSATVTPSSGPPGTTFVFRTNLGDTSILSLYRDDALVRSVTLKGGGNVRYAIHTSVGDTGSWRARAEIRGHAGCASSARFTVTRMPDTATAAVTTPVTPGGPSWLLLGLAVWLGSVLGLRRSGSARRPCGDVRSRPARSSAAAVAGPRTGSLGVSASGRNHRQRISWRWTPHRQ